jgi:hypothetical protein
LRRHRARPYRGTTAERLVVSVDLGPAVAVRGHTSDGDRRPRSGRSGAQALARVCDQLVHHHGRHVQLLRQTRDSEVAGNPQHDGVALAPQLLLFALAREVVRDIAPLAWANQERPIAPVTTARTSTVHRSSIHEASDGRVGERAVCERYRSMGDVCGLCGSIRILACVSGWLKAANAASTPSSPTVPVTSDRGSTLPSASMCSASRNSSGE